MPCVIPCPNGTGCDENVVVTRVVADERETVHRLQHLSRPTIFDKPNVGEYLARPSFETIESCIRVVGLTGLVIFSADDQNIVLIRMRLQADVMVRVLRVPIKRSCRFPLGTITPITYVL